MITSQCETAATMCSCNCLLNHYRTKRAHGCYLTSLGSLVAVIKAAEATAANASSLLLLLLLYRAEGFLTCVSVAVFIGIPKYFIIFSLLFFIHFLLQLSRFLTDTR